MPTATSFITTPRYFHDIGNKHKTLNETAETDAERHRIKRELTGSRDLARSIECPGIQQEIIADKHKKTETEYPRTDVEDPLPKGRQTLYKEIDEDMTPEQGGDGKRKTYHHGPAEPHQLIRALDRAANESQGDIGNGEEHDEYQRRPRYPLHIPAQSLRNRKKGFHRFPPRIANRACGTLSPLASTNRASNFGPSLKEKPIFSQMPCHTVQRAGLPENNRMVDHIAASCQEIFVVRFICIQFHLSVRNASAFHALSHVQKSFDIRSSTFEQLMRDFSRNIFRIATWLTSPCPCFNLSGNEGYYHPFQCGL